MREAIAEIAELLRRVGRASADGAAGFLFSTDTPQTSNEQEEDLPKANHDVPADSAEVRDLEHVRDSPLDAICQDVTESMDVAGVNQDHQGGEGIVLQPEAGQEQSVHYSR